MNETAPGHFRARFRTSQGDFVVAVHREWAPHGADRFYNLVKNGFYNDARFFRVIDGFMVQFGISGNPDLSAVWREAQIEVFGTALLLGFGGLSVAWRKREG